MRTFNSLRELINYVKSCPVCFSKRELILSLGPEIEVASTIVYEDENIFQIEGIHKKSSDSFLISINLDTNEFRVISEAQIVQSIQLYFYLYANCSNMIDKHTCNCCINTEDIDLNSSFNQIENLCIEYESVWLTRTEYPFHISIQANNMKVTKMHWENGELIDNTNEIRVPLVDLDFSDEISAVQKIRTMLVFS